MSKLGLVVLVAVSLGMVVIGVVGLSHLHDQAPVVGPSPSGGSSTPESQVLAVVDGGVLFALGTSGQAEVHTAGWVDVASGAVRTWAFDGTAQPSSDGRALLAHADAGVLELWTAEGSRRVDGTACNVEVSTVPLEGDGTVLDCNPGFLRMLDGGIVLADEADLVPETVVAFQGNVLFTATDADGNQRTHWLGAEVSTPVQVLDGPATLWHLEKGLATLHTDTEVVVLDLRTGAVGAREGVDVSTLAPGTTLSVTPFSERGLLGCAYERWSPRTLKRHRVVVAPCTEPVSGVGAAGPSLAVLHLDSLLDGAGATLVHDDGRNLRLPADARWEHVTCTATTCVGREENGALSAVDLKTFTVSPLPRELDVGEVSEVYVTRDTFVVHRATCLELLLWVPGSPVRSVGLDGPSRCALGTPAPPPRTFEFE